MSYNKITKVGYIICFIACLIFYIYVGNIYENSKLKHETNIIESDVNEIFTGWSIVKDEGWNKSPSSKYVAIKNVLPKTYISETSICFSNYQEIFEVFVDGKSIYEFGTDYKDKISQTPGSEWHIIKLLEEYRGKEITIKIYDPYNEYKGKLDGIFIGSKISHLKMIIEKHIGAFIGGLIMFAISIILMVVYCFSKDVRKYNSNIIYFGIFLFIISLWSIIESKLLQLFGLNSFLLFCQAFITVALIPLSFIMYIKSEFDYKRENLTNVLICIYIIMFIIMLLLQSTGRVDLKKTIIISHVFMVVTAIECFRILINYFKEKQKNKFESLKAIGVPLIFFVFSAFIVDLTRYYTTDYIEASFFTRWIHLGFVFLILVRIIKIYLNKYFDRVKEDTYKELAYIDTMTGLKNRNCFQEKIIELNENLSTDTNLGFLIFDINGLKIVNDRYGHLKGDELIINASKIVKSTFDKCGEVFRIGGDEFCVIVENTDEVDSCICDFEQFLEKQKDIETYNRVMISYGYKKFDWDLNKDLYDLFDKADKKMYENKCNCKKRDKLI